MEGLSQDILVVIKAGSLFFGLFGAVIVGRCAFEALCRVVTPLRRWRRRPRISYRTAMRAYAEGEIERAHLMLHRVLVANPDHYKGYLAMWQVARDAGYPEEAEQAMLCAIQIEVNRGDRASAVRHWLELGRASVSEVQADPNLLVRLGSLLEEANRSLEARGVFQRALDRCWGRSEMARIASRVACAAVDVDREMAEAAAWEALCSESLDLTDRLGLQALLNRLYPDGDPTLDLDLDLDTAAAA